VKFRWPFEKFARLGQCRAKCSPIAEQTARATTDKPNTAARIQEGYQFIIGHAYSPTRIIARGVRVRYRASDGTGPRPVPGGGRGRRLTDMLHWCRENVPAGTWAQHRHSERRTGEAPRNFARFYFVSEADTEAFRRRWSRTHLRGDL